MDNPTLWYVNIFVTDFDRALEFYRDRMGFETVVEDKSFGYASFRTQGAGFAFAVVEPGSEQAALAGRHTGIGWGVPDVDAAHAELAAQGVEFDSPPARQPWGGYMAMLRDPDGNVFYLDQMEEA